uniref:RING-type domain-containing protein n=1 Tax=Ascaris lumbricoides TaxID=6252 RepID=A0A0M3HZ17_ASCLU
MSVKVVAGPELNYEVGRAEPTVRCIGGLVLNTRRTTGITMDELMETTADDPLAMLHPSGKFVVPIMHWKARQQKKTELSRAPEPDNRVIPPELKCPLCAQLLRDAVLTTCCGDSFCAECVQQRLLESVNAKCPGANCIQTSISADKIVPNLKVRQAVEAFKKAAPSAQNVASNSQRSPVLQQRSVDTPPIPEEPPKVQAQPVPRVRIGLGSRVQATQQLDSSQQNAMPTQEQQPQPSSATSSLEDSGISSMPMGVQAIRPPVPVPQQQQQQLPQLPPPAPQPQPVVGGVVLAPAPPSLESPKMATTIAMPPMAPMAPPITPMLLPVGGVLPVNVHEPPPGYAPVVTTAPPTAPIPSSTKVMASADGRGVAPMLPSMTAPPPPIIVQPPPLQQPPPPGLPTATTFPPVPAPPPVRDAWDEFLERKEKDRLLGATQVSRRRHSSPSESYSSTESSTQSSSDSRSRSRSWSRERGRRERRHDSKERRHSRRIESRSPPRLYAGPPRYYRDSASSHNIYQHPPPAPLNASQTTFAHHRLPALINYPPPSFLQTSNTSLGGFQSMPASVPPSGGYRGARGCVDDRSQRRRSPPRVTETDRRVPRRGSTGREREGERKRTDESRRRVRENEERNVRGDERLVRNKPREGIERDERRNRLREGISRKRRDRVEMKGEAPATNAASEKVSKKEVNTSIDAGKGRRSHTANVITLKDEVAKKEGEKDVAEKEEETVKASQETVEEGQATTKEETVEKEEEVVRIEELETFSEVFTEREDENQTIDVSGVETKEPESEEAAVAEGTDGSVSGADAENEDGTEVVEESGEQEKSEKKKRKRKKRRKRDNRSEGEREKKKRHKQHKEDTSEEHDNHKKNKKHKRTREEKERHREEKERRREEKKRRRERQEESGDADDVDANAVVEIGAESHVVMGVETNKQSEHEKDAECLKEISNETSKQTVQQPREALSEEHGEKSAKRESGKKEQRREEPEMSESGKKTTKVEEERVKPVKRAKENGLDEGTGEKRNKPSGASEKRVLKKRPAEEEEEKKKEPRKDHYGVNDSRRRDERRFRGGDVAARSERGTHRTDANSSHQQSTKRRAEGRDESRERKDTKIRRDDDGIRGKEGRSQVGRDTDRPLNNTRAAEERHSEKRRCEADRDEQKKPRESATGVTKRNEERPRESKSKEEEHAEKGKRIRKDEESVVRSEKKDVDKVSNVNKEEPIKKITHRRERDETNKSSVKDDSETKKLDEIKVSIENELASERKLDTSTSSTSGESHRDKPNITVELKYGGEKKVTRENVFENSVPQFNARQKIKMILLSESERFAVDRAKKRNVK